MKKGIVLFVINIGILLIGLSSKFWTYTEEEYLSKKVLEKTTPFSVTIDVEYLRSLDPAYEQQ